MRCPYCADPKTGVLKTERPIDEGLAEGEIKRRTRKCRACARNFVTFEIHESTWRQVPVSPSLERRPLLNESVDGVRGRRKSPH